MIDKKILIVFGTRPEAIKMAPVVEALHGKDVEAIICSTGQHVEMLNQVMELFGITADHKLGVMKRGQSLEALTAAVLGGVSDLIRKVKPDIVLVHGDTTTSMAAAMASFYNQVDVGHVEAGLRTGNIYEPWPEEMNRRLIGNIARYHFAPTASAHDNLVGEGVLSNSIIVTGNTVIDALMSAVARLEGLEKGYTDISARFEFVDHSKRLILVTGHRRENFGKGFESICRALKEIATRKDVQVCYPVHLNPSVLGPVKQMLRGIDNVFLIEPVDYFSFVYLMKRSYLILTDSGGVQEEAPALGKPVLVMRNTTERPEAIAAGTASLVGVKTRDIVEKVNSLLDGRDEYRMMSRAKNPFGDGRAAKRIADYICAL